MIDKNIKSKVTTNNMIKSIIKEVLKEIKPDNASLLKVKQFIDELNQLLKQESVDATAVLGGSMAKNTFIKGDYDADIFIKFSKNYKGKNISKILGETLNKKYKFERVKGSRDYFHIQKDFMYELVPVLDVKSIQDAENVIDMSPMHVDYFKLKGKYLEDEVRLLKKFMKSNRVYGAESYINGFSGHVVDLLVIKYGSFQSVIKNACKWETPVIIDLEKKLKDPLMELDKAKISGPLIIVDPVQENRNAAAALSYDCFNDFVESAKKFLDEPRKDFFKKKSAKDIINKNGYLYELIIEPMNKSKDVAGSKILKIIKHILKELEQNDFSVKEYQWDFNDRGYVYILLENDDVESEKIVRGPPLNVKKHCEIFGNKHDKTFEKNDYLYAKIQRKYTRAEDLIRHELNSKYVKERCKNSKAEKID